MPPAAGTAAPPPKRPPLPPLKAGQRHPTKGDSNDAFWERNTPKKSSHFPITDQWEITPEHCQAWSRHNFSGRRGDTNHFRRLGDLSTDEFALLLWDLNAWFDLQSKWAHAVALRRAHARFCAEADAGTHTRPNWYPPPLPNWQPVTLEAYLRVGREDWGWLGGLIAEWLDG